MKTRIGIPPIPPLHLPVEIINTIVLFVKQRLPERDYQYALWACSLVSKSFYQATIAHLYEFPNLNNRNFDKFSRTICPPVNSHIRRIGLEHLVKHLDMGKLAYESSRSLTARLLRRTKESLETFIAPAVSFSVVSLAPLSKCLRLKILDLSTDFYDIDLPALFHSIGSLQHLDFLSLPKSAFGPSNAGRRVPNEVRGWPPNLTHLQMNDGLPANGHDWEVLIRHWPASLSSISFHGMSDYNSLWVLAGTSLTIPQITSITIGEARHADPAPIYSILAAFTHLEHFTCAPQALKFANSPEATVSSIDNVSSRAQHLENLTILPTSPVYPIFLSPQAHLKPIFEHSPNLRRLVIPRNLLNLDQEEILNQFEDLEEFIERRSQQKSCNSTDVSQNNSKPAGIYLQKNLECVQRTGISTDLFVPLRYEMAFR